MKLDDFAKALQRVPGSMEQQAHDYALERMRAAAGKTLDDLPGKPKEIALMHDSIFGPNSLNMELGIMFSMNDDGSIEVDVADPPPPERGLLSRVLRRGDRHADDLPSGYGKITASWTRDGGHELALHLRDREIERIKFNKGESSNA